MPSRVQQIETIQAFLQDAKALKKKHVSWKKMLPSIQAIVDGDDQLLSTKYRDHALTGSWSGYRELHIEGDWLLVYFIDGDGLVLVLTRTSTHDELYSTRTSKQQIRQYKYAERQSFPKN